MAIEAKRGCGYRKVGGLYLVGEGIAVACDRLPYPLEHCPTCGAGIHFTRGITEINPIKLFGFHQNCCDPFSPCWLCTPEREVDYLMMVGEKYYTPQSFMEEANRLGVSKRLPSDHFPKKLKLGESIIYLAHPQACDVKQPAVLQQAMAIVAEKEEGQKRLLEAEKNEKALGIFMVFRPRRIEKIVWQSEIEGEAGLKYKESLEKRGITVVPVPDGDKDHV